MHGDHVFGLPGLISTLNLLGRTADLTIYAHQELEVLLRPVLNFYCNHLVYNVNIIYLQKEGFNPIFENQSITVYSFPLKHRIASSGFLFKEKDKMRHIKREMIDFYKIPIREINNIKNGANYVTSEGKEIDNKLLTAPPNPPRSYAYCSDTAYNESILPYIKQVDVLYHESTFAESEKDLAEKTVHSTASQAAKIAKLATVEKLVIGHFSSRYRELDRLLEEAKIIFPNTELAFEGKMITL